MHNPTLYELATTSLITERSTVILFHHGQAAQLDGVIPLPPNDWNNPASLRPEDYEVPHQVIVNAYAANWQLRCLKDTNLDPNAPPVPPEGTTYPIDEKKYLVSPTILRSRNTQLCNLTLAFIGDAPLRAELSRQFPNDGRGLLEHLRNLANTPLTTSQISSIFADIETLTNRGVKEDTVTSFREFVVVYHNLTHAFQTTTPTATHQQ